MAAFTVPVPIATFLVAAFTVPVFIAVFLVAAFTVPVPIATFLVATFLVAAFTAPIPIMARLMATSTVPVFIAVFLAPAVFLALVTFRIAVLSFFLVAAVAIWTTASAIAPTVTRFTPPFVGPALLTRTGVNIGTVASETILTLLSSLRLLMFTQSLSPTRRVAPPGARRPAFASTSVGLAAALKTAHHLAPVFFRSSRTAAFIVTRSLQLLPHPSNLLYSAANAAHPVRTLI